MMYEIDTVLKCFKNFFVTISTFLLASIVKLKLKHRYYAIKHNINSRVSLCLIIHNLKANVFWDIISYMLFNHTYCVISLYTYCMVSLISYIHILSYQNKSYYAPHYFLPCKLFSTEEVGFLGYNDFRKGFTVSQWLPGSSVISKIQADLNLMHKASRYHLSERWAPITTL